MAKQIPPQAMTDMEALALGSLTLVSLPLILWGIPCALAYAICEKKNRNPWKGVVLAVLFGWLAPLGLWLALKTRDPKTRELY